MTEIKSINDVEKLANNFVQQSNPVEQQITDRAKTLTEIIDKIGDAKQLYGTESLLALLELQDGVFSVISPVFISELQRSLNNINDKLIILKALNIEGVTIEDLHQQFKEISNQLDNIGQGIISQQKIDFIKTIISTIYNSIEDTEMIAKRNIVIPTVLMNDEAKLPKYAHESDAAMDIYATQDITLGPGETTMISTGVKMAIPNGYAVLIQPRSGLSAKTRLRISNSPGLIDSGYRGEIKVLIENTAQFIKSADIDENGRLYNILFGESYTIEKGQRIAQMRLVEIPKAVLVQVEQLDDTQRGQGGFGSSGTK